MEAIVAVYTDWGIGDGQTQPVTVHADRIRFRELTGDAAVLCGRKTLEDFPGGKPLKGRHNIVLTRQKTDISGAEVVRSKEEALQAAEKAGKCFVIGGASVFELFYPELDRVYVTKLDCCPESAKFFPNLDQSPDWICAVSGEWMEENGIRYCFCEYRKLSHSEI